MTDQQTSMVKIKQDEIQGLLLGILKAFREYALSKDLEFFLAGGTLLGAIRHKGFIPWDDDIDVFLRESEFERFCAEAAKDPFIDAEKRYKVLLPGSDENIYPIIKIIDTKTIVYEQNVDRKHAMGLWLDVFCMSYWPNSVEKSVQKFNKQRKYNRIWMICVCGNLQKRKYKLIYPFILPIKKILEVLHMDYRFWVKKILKLGKQEPTNYIGVFCFASDLRDRYLKKYYDHSIEVEFEGDTYSAPADYDYVLTQFYGDYMQLPPVEKRIRHDFDAFYK